MLDICHLCPSYSPTSTQVWILPELNMRILLRFFQVNLLKLNTRILFGFWKLCNRNCLECNSKKTNWTNKGRKAVEKRRKNNCIIVKSNTIWWYQQLFCYIYFLLGSIKEKVKYSDETNLYDKTCLYANNLHNLLLWRLQSIWLSREENSSTSLHPQFVRICMLIGCV